jgi:hypothetical protein
MSLYLVSYDLAKYEGPEYEALQKTLKDQKAIQILYSEWLIKAGIDYAQDLYDLLLPFVPTKCLLVQEVTKKARFGKLLISDETMDALLLAARP